MLSLLLLLGISVAQVFQADASNVYKQSFTFSNQTQFADLSVYNFDKGLSYTYQYVITARPNRQVTIHFLTNPRQNAYIVLHDGVDATAPIVDTSKLYKIITSGSECQPVPITSTGRSFFLEVTPLTTNNAIKQDFQAIATDLVQPSACGALVNCADSNRVFPRIVLASPAEGCIHIMRIVDYSNNKNDLLSITWIDTDVTTLVYKGLSMNPVTKLVTLNSEISYNEKNIIIQHKRTMTINYGYTNDLDAVDIVNYNAMNSKQTKMFITGDYYPARPIGATETTKIGFYFQPMFQVDSLKINFFTGIGEGSLLVTYMNFQQANKTVTYTKANFPKTLTITTAEADEFLLSYSCTGTTCTGLYGTVEDATNL